MDADSLYAGKPRGCDGRAPDPLRVGGWSPMRMFRDDEPVDFVIVGTGAGGGGGAGRVAEQGVFCFAFGARDGWGGS